MFCFVMLMRCAIKFLFTKRDMGYMLLSLLSFLCYYVSLK